MMRDTYLGELVLNILDIPLLRVWNRICGYLAVCEQNAPDV
jgi:hypothetical protein